jgi:hypothetical protein
MCNWYVNKRDNEIIWNVQLKPQRAEMSGKTKNRNKD